MDNKKFYNNTIKSILIEKQRLEHYGFKPTHITMNVYDLEILCGIYDYAIQGDVFGNKTVFGLRIIPSNCMIRNKFVIGLEYDINSFE